MDWPKQHPPAAPPPTEAELAAHAKRTEAKRAKIEALERAERELPEASDCRFEFDVESTTYPVLWECLWPANEDCSFERFWGSGTLPSIAHENMLQKLTEALDEKRLRDEDCARMNDAMMRAKDGE